MTQTPGWILKIYPKPLIVLNQGIIYICDSALEALNYIACTLYIVQCPIQKHH